MKEYTATVYDADGKRLIAVAVPAESPNAVRVNDAGALIVEGKTDGKYMARIYAPGNWGRAVVR